MSLCCIKDFLVPFCLKLIKGLPVADVVFNSKTSFWPLPTVNFVAILVLPLLSNVIHVVPSLSFISLPLTWRSPDIVVSDVVSAPIVTSISLAVALPVSTRPFLVPVPLPALVATSNFNKPASLLSAAEAIWDCICA